LLAACRGDDAAKAEATARDLVLADARAWYERAFGAEHEHLAGLTAEYAQQVAQVQTLPGAIRAQFAEGNTDVLTERFIDPGDELATGFQAVALRAMSAPIALYSLRLIAPGQESGWHLWSFAHVDGHYRFVGQMHALAPEATEPLLRSLGSLRVKEAAEIRAKWDSPQPAPDGADGK
ncbi:MAG: hypothetical protein O2894_09685, partial [Planctomycetota bacterium]|nr:hypothetical protein [Planctomycetota bacterium]